MGKKRMPGRAIDEQVRRARRAAHEAVENARRSGKEHHISVAGRTNIAARVNTGEDGAVAVATGRQESTIVQGSAENTADPRQSGT